MHSIKHCKTDELPVSRKREHDGYEYDKQIFMPRSCGSQTMVCIYKIPPLKSAYPYHYHLKNEETFYIISGEGVLKTPDGERTVSAGDLLFFPACCEGAHKLTNASSTEALVYIDFDVTHDLDVAIYPDSEKIGIWGKGVHKMYQLHTNVDYYEGE